MSNARTRSSTHQLLNQRPRLKPAASATSPTPANPTQPTGVNSETISNAPPTAPSRLTTPPAVSPLRNDLAEATPKPIAAVAPPKKVPAAAPIAMASVDPRIAPEP